MQNIYELGETLRREHKDFTVRYIWPHIPVRLNSFNFGSM